MEQQPAAKGTEAGAAGDGAGAATVGAGAAACRQADLAARTSRKTRWCLDLLGLIRSSSVFNNASNPFAIRLHARDKSLSSFPACVRADHIIYYSSVKRRHSILRKVLVLRLRQTSLYVVMNIQRVILGLSCGNLNGRVQLFKMRKIQRAPGNRKI